MSEGETQIQRASRVHTLKEAIMIEKKRTPNFHPGGQKGKLHREMGIPEGEKIPPKKLEAATHSKSREVRDDAIRAETMKGWNHKGRGKGA